jgi:hypothetical protein
MRQCEIQRLGYFLAVIVSFAKEYAVKHNQLIPVDR